MDTTPFCVLVNKVIASDRIVFGDLRRLQRDALPTGATSREEIEILLALDSLGQLDEDWPGQSQSAQTIKLSPNIPKPVPGLRKALHRLKVRQDALVVRILPR